MQYDRRLADSGCSHAVMLVKMHGAEGIMSLGVGAHMPRIGPAMWVSVKVRCR